MAAAQQAEEPECTLLSDTNENSLSSLQGMQTFATGAEKEQWRKSRAHGATMEPPDKINWAPSGQPRWGPLTSPYPSLMGPTWVC
ncbi:hypothetical protein ROHU_010292 [Labeo rohita]|uniref:Uncharacterized protein n=1 Tax=Labeo rohita TaxID=84645 RepID=A0A498LVG9_LABRO|nr:hypothetical protein ROHU_010292 [Labeo rohita]